MSVYPKLAGDAILTQYPYTETDEWVVAESSVPAGFSYTRTQHTTVLRRWVLRYPAIQRADVVILEAFWNDRRGSYNEFSFTDDQAVTWTHTRFDQDTFSVQYVGPNQYSVEIHLSAEAN